MAVSTQIGLPGVTGPGTTEQIIERIGMDLTEGSVPVFRSADSMLRDSGFMINAANELTGTTKIQTTDDIEAGVGTFNLATAHAMSSAAENVTFTNEITNTTYHPTWQTAEPAGTWRSVQRSPVGNLVVDAEVQDTVDNSQDITNPDFMITSFPFNHRIYEFHIEPVNSVNGVRFVMQRNNGTAFVDYWRSRRVNLVATAQGTTQNIVIRPFIDLEASTPIRIFIEADEDVILRGDSTGFPRIQLHYRQFQDDDLALASETASTFLDLTDTPAAYTANTFARVNAAGDAVEFIAITPGQAGITIQDSGTEEGTAIATLNFNDNLTVDISGGVASIDGPAPGPSFSEAQTEFISRLTRETLVLIEQQGVTPIAFDLGLFENAIDVTDRTPGSDLGILNARDSNEFSSTTESGPRFVYILFQGAGRMVGDEWKLVRTNAGRTTAELLGDLNDDFTEIDVPSSALTLFMSNSRIQYNPNDVIAIYTTSGGVIINLDGTNINLSDGIPAGSITPDQLAPSITSDISWQACTITAGNPTTVTLPDGSNVEDFNDISAYWNSGTGAPTPGEGGNANRQHSVTGNFLPIAEGLVASNRALLIGGSGRGASQYSVQINGVTDPTLATQLIMEVVDINSISVPAGFVITHVWVR